MARRPNRGNLGLSMDGWIQRLALRPTRAGKLTTPATAGGSGTLLTINGLGGTFKIGDFVDTVLQQSNGVNFTSTFAGQIVDDGSGVPALQQLAALTGSQQSVLVEISGRSAAPLS